MAYLTSILDKKSPKNIIINTIGNRIIYCFCMIISLRMKLANLIHKSGIIKKCPTILHNALIMSEIDINNGCHTFQTAIALFKGI